jgi:tight adherence protein C
MTVVPSLLVAGAIGVLATRRRWSWSAAAGLFMMQPLVALSGGLAVTLGLTVRRLRASRLGRDAATRDVTVLVELVGLGLSAGLTLSRSLAAARPFVHPDLDAEVGEVLRRSARGGLGQALAAADGHGRSFYAGAARAVVTGAPLAPAVDAFVREAIAEQRAADLESARRLPVRLMLPLALLILPGFVLLTVGPTVLVALERFVLPH